MPHSAMTHLFVDIGNTRVKWRHADIDAGYTARDAQGSMATDTDVGVSLTRAWRALRFTSVWIANVATQEPLEDVLRAVRTCQPQSAISVIVSESRRAGVVNSYIEPHRLGADRWAALIGARALYPQHAVLIVSLGTATTIDLLSADGRYRGGVILPGAAMMRRSLAEGTAQLPLARGQGAVLAQDTENAIESGIIHAQAGAIERVLRQIEAESTDPPLRVLTGGDAEALAPHLPFSTAIVDNLVLRGLLEIARDAAHSRTLS